jgi:hypothetical protein
MAARALDVQGPNLSVGADGIRLRPLQEDSFLAEILGNDGGSPVKHSWRAVVENANGTISAAEPAFTGSTTMRWAVFPGGGAVPNNSLVRLRKGLSGEWYEIVAWARLHMLDISGRTGAVTDVLSAQFLRTVVSGTPDATVITPDDASKIREGDVNLLNDQVLGDGRKIFSDQVVINADGVSNRVDDNAHLVVRSSQYPTPFTNLLTVADGDGASFQSAYVSIGDHVMPGQLAVRGAAVIDGNASIGSAINVGNNIDAGFDFTGTSLEPYQPVGGIFEPQQGYAGLGLYLYRAGHQCVLFPNTAPLGGLATLAYCVASVALNDYTLHIGQTGGIGPESAFTGGILTDGGSASFGELASANSITSVTVADFTEAAQDAVGAMCTDGTLQYDDATPYLRRAAISGDVTISAGNNSATISDDTVTNAKAAANEEESTARDSAEPRENATFRVREKCEKRLKTRPFCESRRAAFMRMSRISPNRARHERDWVFDWTLFASPCAVLSRSVPDVYSTLDRSSHAFPTCLYSSGQFVASRTHGCVSAILKTLALPLWSPSPSVGPRSSCAAASARWLRSNAGFFKRMKLGRLSGPISLRAPRQPRRRCASMTLPGWARSRPCWSTPAGCRPHGPTS